MKTQPPRAPRIDQALKLTESRAGSGRWGGNNDHITDAYGNH